MDPFDDQTRLLQALFDAPTTGRWPEFVALLARLTGASGAGLWIAPNHAVWHQGTRLALPDSLRAQLRAQRVYGTGEAPGLADDGVPLRLVCARRRVDAADTAAPLEVGVWITRDRVSRDFRAADGLLLAGLAPFLTQAADARARHEEQAAHARSHAFAAARAGIGWVLFDRNGAVRDASALARDWAACAGVRLEQGRRPDWPDASDAAAFRQAFGAALAGVVPGLLRMPGPQPAHALVQLEPNGIFLRLQVEPRLRSVSVNALARAHGLTASEARLAACLADGLTLRAAAQDLGWTEETARSTSKTLYSRLGAAGQTGVLRRLLLAPTPVSGG